MRMNALSHQFGSPLQSRPLTMEDDDSMVIVEPESPHSNSNAIVTSHESYHASETGADDSLLQEDQPSQSQQNFTIVAVKSIAHPPKLVSWSQTMDLVALVLIDNSVMIHRLNWQKLWTISDSSDKNIVSLAWRPDGKSIVTSYDDGHFSIWDIENGLLQYSTLKHGSASFLKKKDFTFCTWFDKQSSKSIGGKPPSIQSQYGNPSYQSILKRRKYADPGKSQLAPLWPLPGVDSPEGILFSSNTMTEEDSMKNLNNYLGESSTTRLERSEPQDDPNFLIFGDSEASLFIFALGTFQVAHINVIQHMEQHPKLREELKSGTISNVGILAAQFSNDMSCLSMVVQTRKKDDSIAFDETGNECGPKSKTLILQFETQFFKRQQAEILALVWQSILIQDLYYRIAALTERMALMWSNAITPLLTKLATFKTQVKLESLLLNMLAVGIIAPELEMLLVVKLGAKAVQNMEKSITSTCNQLILLVSQHLRPTVERIIYRLVVISGYSKWKQAFGSVGIDENCISVFLNFCHMFLAQCDAFIPVISRAKQIYSNFLIWIHQFCKDPDDPTVEIPSSGNVNHSLVNDFLQSEISQDFVGEVIRGKIGVQTQSKNEFTAKKEAIPAQPSFLPKKEPQQPQQQPSLVVKAGLDDSLGLDSSVDYNDQSMIIDENEPTTGISPVLSLSTPKDKFAPSKSQSIPMIVHDESSFHGDFSPEGQSSPQASSPSAPGQMAPISISFDPATAPSSLPMNPPLEKIPSTLFNWIKSDYFENPCFSKLRIQIQRLAEILFNSVSTSLSSQIKLVSHLTLFTKNEFLPENSEQDSNVATEVFPFAEFTKQVRNFYSIQFIPNPSDCTFKLLFRVPSNSTIWVLKVNKQQSNHLQKDPAKVFSFEVSGLEVSIKQSGPNSIFTSVDDFDVKDIKYYQDGQALLLLSSSLEAHLCQLQMLDLQNLQYYPMQVHEINDNDGVINYFEEIAMINPFQHTSEELCSKFRDTSNLDAAYVALSGPRGLGLIVCGSKKAAILDIENDEQPEEEEEPE